MLRDRFFTVARKNPIEGGVNRGREGAVIPCPELRDSGGASFASHVENVVGLLEIEGEADGVPALAERGSEFGSRRIFENRNTGNVWRRKRRPKEIRRGMPKRQRKLRGAFSRK